MLQGCLLLKPIFLQLTPWVMVRDKKLLFVSYRRVQNKDIPILESSAWLAEYTKEFRGPAVWPTTQARCSDGLAGGQ